jgi:hypothetical protein
VLKKADIKINFYAGQNSITAIRNKVNKLPVLKTLSVIQGDQKVSVRLMITMQTSGARRLFDHPVLKYF